MPHLLFFYLSKRIAVAALLIRYWLSSVFAPAHVGEMHDVIYVIRNSLNHRMLVVRL